MQERKGDWIQTHNKVKFYPLDPRPEEILLDDIANGLSLCCRFTGQTPYLYTVAQHSILVADLLPYEMQLYGLLHDASEAYLNDMARPTKRLPELATFRQIDKDLQAAIYRKFGLNPEEPPQVKEADTIALGLECLYLMSPLVEPDKWEWCVQPAKKFLSGLKSPDTFAKGYLSESDTRAVRHNFLNRVLRRLP